MTAEEKDDHEYERISVADIDQEDSTTASS